MKIRRLSLSITQKILLFILPLVCIPIIGVGFFSYNASVERMTHLLKEEQLLKAKAVASNIDEIFRSCLLDLETMSHWNMGSNYQSFTIAPDDLQTEDRKNEIRSLFSHFIVRSELYDYISLHYPDTRESIAVARSEYKWEAASKLPEFVQEMLDKNVKDIFISNIYFSKARNKYLIHVGLAVKNRQDTIERILVIDLDFSKLMESILDIRVGKNGYAFMVDKLGRTITHPHYKPYDYNFTKYDDPRLREFVIDMISGDTGWKRYDFFGEMAAAIAPITTPGWSIAVCVPIEEFKSEANALRSIVIQTVVFILVVSIIILSFLSYRIVTPIKRLVAATEQVAKGDLLQEIPITSGGELGVLTHSFNSMIKSLRTIQFELIRSERLISMGKLAAGVAHEIRNPLNAMKGAITYLKRHQGNNPATAEFTQLILEEINRLSRFVNEFLHYAKLSPPKPIPADVNELIENTINLYTEEFREKQITVSKHLQSDLPVIPVDVKQMEQVLVNIFINAIDSYQHPGTITIRSHFQEQTIRFCSQSAVVITIADTGSGIPAEHLKNIFDPFFSTKENGTGLGLPISLNIVENHGGTMTINSKENVGTEVVIILLSVGKKNGIGVSDETENPDRG